MMIQVYLPGNTDYKKNGDITLFPISAEVDVELNAAWYLSLEHPLDKKGRWKYIVDQAVIKAQSFNGEQLFRIKKKIKTDTSVQVTAEPIFMDSRDDCFLPDIRPTEKTGQQALDLMMAPNKKYSGKSDITSLHTAYYEFKNLIEAINGSDENSFINRWGGEILFNNFEVIINNRVGGDYGVQILYGKNIKKDGIKEDVDFTDVVTRIYPKAYNGYAMTANGYVDSPLATTYPTVKAKTITFSDVKMREDAREGDTENGIIICDTQQELDEALSKRCQEEYAAGIDKPSVQITCDIIMLQNIDEYAEYAGLETVSIGDTVHLKHELLDIESDARVIKLKYDCIREKVSSVVIGDFQDDYFNTISSDMGNLEGKISSLVGSDGRIPAENVYGILDGIKTQMRAQRTIASKQDVRAMICEDLDPESPTYGAMCYGSMGFMIASERTADGRDWNWKTFGTGKGFFADYIVAGSLLADLIKAGKIVSQNGRVYFDLDNNELACSKMVSASSSKYPKIILEFFENQESGGLSTIAGLHLFPEEHRDAGIVFNTYTTSSNEIISDSGIDIDWDTGNYVSMGGKRRKSSKGDFEVSMNSGASIIASTDGSIKLSTATGQYVDLGARLKVLAAQMPSITSSYATHLAYDSSGIVGFPVTSTKRIKHDIKDISEESLQPERLYDIPVKQYVYNCDALPAYDERYNKPVVGLLAEDVDVFYPVAAVHDKDGNAVNWDERYIIPPLLSLVQKQKEEIDILKRKVENLIAIVGKDD